MAGCVSRPLDPASCPSMKVTVRPASAEDRLLYVRLLPELGVDDPPPDEERWARELQPWTLVAERGGEAVGVCTWVRLEGSGHVRTLIVDPHERRTGAGRALLGVVAEKLRAAGCTSWALNVKPENVAAVTLYSSLGFKRAYGSVAMRFEWATVERLPAGPAVQARPVTPHDDPALERLFSLPAGQVQGLRASQRVLLTLVDEAGRVAALSAYNPNYPGAFPFRVGDPLMARALLQTMRPYALPGAEWTGLVVENDDGLVALLRAHGASVRMNIDHYVGAL